MNDLTSNSNSYQLFDSTKLMIKELELTNSTNAKKEILAKNTTDIIAKVLFYTYNPFFTFGITTKMCAKYPNERTCMQLLGKEDLFDILDMLAQRMLTGKAAVGAINDYVLTFPEDKDLVYRILDRDLKCRTTAKIINKMLGNLIPVFEVALAKNFEDTNACNKEVAENDYYVCQKFDGFRTIIMISNEKVEYFTRKGHKVTTLEKLTPFLQEWYKTTPFSGSDTQIVLDGEACIIDENGNDDFNSCQSELTTQDYTAERPKIYVFDLLTKHEFDTGTSELDWSTRIYCLELFEFPNNEHLKVLERDEYNEENMTKWRKLASDNGWEGLILRKDATYKNGRSRDILKVKDFIEEEFIVKAISSTEIEMLINKIMVRVPAVGAFTVEYKGEDVGVGPGTVKKEMLVEYHNNPVLIVGKEVTVKYFEESKNKDGRKSMRFPVIKVVWENGRNV